MLHVHHFTFNPIQENTYIVYDETKECVLIDPGCYGSAERNILTTFISENGLKPVKLLLTHAHVDHVPGLGYVADTYKLVPHYHKLEVPVLKAVPSYAQTFGMNITDIPEEAVFIDEGDTLTFGNTTLQILFTPGHSPGSLCFYSPADKLAIAGDVLFRESIGRTDLPGGDFDTLMQSIANKLFTLPDEVRIYPGHGPYTTIAHEKQHNPFIKHIMNK